MTPKEKASELMQKFEGNKQHALICLDQIAQIILVWPDPIIRMGESNFINEVMNEILKMQIN